jgi:hypothetical protein
MHVSAEAPKLDLLALARFNRQRVRVHPLVCRYIGGFGRIRKNVENRRLVDDRQERYRRYDLLQDGPNLRLYLRLRLWGSPANRATNERVVNVIKGAGSLTARCSRRSRPAVQRDGHRTPSVRGAFGYLWK